MRGWGKGLGWVVLRLTLLTWSLGDFLTVSSSTCDTNSSIERRRLSPSRVAPDLRLAAVDRRSDRAWKGAVVGLGALRVAGVS